MPTKESGNGPSEQKLNEVRAERDTLTGQVTQLSQALDTATAHEVLAHRENRALRMQVQQLKAEPASPADAGNAPGNGG